MGRGLHRVRRLKREGTTQGGDYTEKKRLRGRGLEKG